jgi:hypothetical protein
MGDTMNYLPLLAQLGPGMGDFVRQIPVGLLAVMCVVTIILVVALAAIVRARARRGQSTTRSSGSSRPVVPVSMAAKPRDPTPDDDLPDLDMLVSTPLPAPAPAPPPVKKEAPPATPVTRSKPDQTVEVVRILRDVVDGGLIIQMGDKSYRTLTEDEAFRANFLKIMRELSPIVTETPQPVPRTESQQPTQPAEPSLQDLMLSDEDDELDEVDDVAAPAPRPIDLPPSPAGPAPGDLPKWSMDSEPQVIEKRGMLGRTKKEFLPVPELDIAGSIEAYLQHRLKQLPEYARRSIHVHSAPDSGVAIEVDGQFYDAVADVTDSEVRELLTQTIQEWQARNAG